MAEDERTERAEYESAEAEDDRGEQEAVRVS